MSDIAEKLSQKLKSRFSDVLSSGTNFSEPIYIVSSFLDCATTNFLRDEQVNAAMISTKDMVSNIN